jgi:F420-dependent oxidoreductase-like protein
MALKFGLMLPQGRSEKLAKGNDPVQAYETLTRVTQTAESLGFESAWLVDHFLTLPRSTQELTFECWTTTAALARDTQRIRLGQLVTSNGYRQPTLLAKMASTVDVISHGRLNFGIGAGSMFEVEYQAYGYPYPEASERLRALREALQIILAMWTQDEVTFEGDYYQIHGAINQPKGVQQPHIPILIGGGGEKVTLKLVAQYGDACNISGDMETVKRKLAILKAHCEAVGRDYESVHRTVTTLCSIGTTDEEARAKVPPALFNHAFTAGALIGSPETVRQRLAELQEAGIQEVILNMPDILETDTLSIFAERFINR